MKTEVLSALQVKTVELSDIPAGEYKGVWDGYVVDVWINGQMYSMTTDNGIRTPSAPCIVRIKKDSITVEAN